MSNIKHIGIISLLVLALLPVFVFAQGPGKDTKNTLEKPSGPGTSAEQPLIKCGSSDSLNPEEGCTVNDLNKLIQDTVNVVFIFAGFVVAAMFMYAGFLLITAAGNMTQIQKAKDIFRRVVIGFLIMFMSYLTVKNLLTNLDAKSFFINLFKQK